MLSAFLHRPDSGCLEERSGQVTTDTDTPPVRDTQTSHTLLTQINSGLLLSSSVTSFIFSDHHVCYCVVCKEGTVACCLPGKCCITSLCCVQMRCCIMSFCCVQGGCCIVIMYREGAVFCHSVVYREGCLLYTSPSPRDFG